MGIRNIIFQSLIKTSVYGKHILPLYMIIDSHYIVLTLIITQKILDKFIVLNINWKIQRVKKEIIFKWCHMDHKHLPNEEIQKFMLMMVQQGCKITNSWTVVDWTIFWCLKTMKTGVAWLVTRQLNQKIMILTLLVINRRWC